MAFCQGSARRTLLLQSLAEADAVREARKEEQSRSTTGCATTSLDASTGATATDSAVDGAAMVHWAVSSAVVCRSAASMDARMVAASRPNTSNCRPSASWSAAAVAVAPWFPSQGRAATRHLRAARRLHRQGSLPRGSYATRGLAVAQEAQQGTAASPPRFRTVSTHRTGRSLFLATGAASTVPAPAHRTATRLDRRQGQAGRRVLLAPVVRAGHLGPAGKLIQLGIRN